MNRIFVVTLHQEDLDYDETGIPCRAYRTREAAEQGLLNEQKELIRSTWLVKNPDGSEREDPELQAEQLNGAPIPTTLEEYAALFPAILPMIQLNITEIPFYEE